MAAAFAQKYGEARIIIQSGGTHPVDHVHDMVSKRWVRKELIFLRPNPAALQQRN